MSSLDLDIENLSLEDKTVNMNIILVSDDGYLNMKMTPVILEKMLRYSAFIQNLVSGRWDVGKEIRIEVPFGATILIDFFSYISGDMKRTPTSQAAADVERVCAYFGIETDPVSVDHLFILNEENDKIRKEEVEMRNTQSFDDSKHILDPICSVDRKKIGKPIRHTKHLKEYTVHGMAVIATPKRFPKGFFCNEDDRKSECVPYNVFSVFKAQYPENSLIIAGGTALEMYTCASWSKDVDLFITTTDQKKAEADVLEFLEFVAPTKLVRSKNTLTFQVEYDEESVCIEYQIILRLYSSITQVISGFDIDCSCVAFNGFDFYGTPRFRRALHYGYNIADPERQSTTYAQRLFKYCLRDYRIACPGLDFSRIDIAELARSKKRTGLAEVVRVVMKRDRSEKSHDYETIFTGHRFYLNYFFEMVFSKTISILEEYVLSENQRDELKEELKKCGLKPTYDQDDLYFRSIKKHMTLLDCYHMLKKTCCQKLIDIPFQVFYTTEYSQIFSPENDLAFQGEDLKGYIKDLQLRSSLGAFVWMSVDPQRQYTDSFHPTQDDWYYDLYKK